jgi:hypothetical protein
MLAERQQPPGLIQARLDPELVRRETEHRLELADEVKWRDPDLSSHVLDRQPVIVHLAQHVPRPAQAPQRVMFQQHRSVQSNPELTVNS